MQFGRDPDLNADGQRGLPLATIGFSFYTGGLKTAWVDNGMIWFKVLFLLFTCPYCGFVDRARADRAQIEKAARYTLVGQYMDGCE
eukprot:gene46337-47461_t